MPIAKQDSVRFPRSYVFDTFHKAALSVATIGPGAVNTTVQDAYVMSASVKVVKVGVLWRSAVLADAPSFIIVYNTIQNLGSPQVYTQGNTVPNDNSYTGGHSLDNPALKTLYPNFDQTGGLGVPTNVAVDGQPVFATDVVFNTTNFPGADPTLGGHGILVPTNYDAVYPSGPYAYGVGQGMPNAANLSGCLTLRLTNAGLGNITLLRVGLLLMVITTQQTITTSAVLTVPGQFF